MSAFSTVPCPSCSVILLFIVDATILSGRRSDAWSVVPKIPSRYTGNPQSSGTVAICEQYVERFGQQLCNFMFEFLQGFWENAIQPGWHVNFSRNLFDLMLLCIFFWLISLLSLFATKNGIRCGNLPDIFSSKDWGKENFELPCYRLVPQCPFHCCHQGIQLIPCVPSYSWSLWWTFYLQSEHYEGCCQNSSFFLSISWAILVGFLNCGTFSLSF